MATEARAPLGALPSDANNRIFPRVNIPDGGIVTLSRCMGKENAPVKTGKAKNASAGLASSKPASKKRKSDEDLAPEPAINLDDIDLDGAVIDKNCDQVRRLIMRLLDSKAMTKTAFAGEIGVSVKSLNGFLGVHGRMNGAGCAAYGAAWEFFKKREMAGIKMPAPKKQTTKDDNGAAASGSKRAGKAQPAGEVDVSDIVLPGEEDDSVPGFDTCDEVRKKINAYLQRPGVTQASLCRSIHAQLKGPSRPEKPFQSAQLARFRNMKGPRCGVKLSLFYGAYVFFEKLRIKEGKPKSKHRLDMEEEWGPGGLSRDFDERQP
ncbi:hypothetical protein VTJ49DRAFT_406 [Mycothermus thermophilus]|uniref:DUF7726 domain-containing protein n=1 Tax=Humicola insolens TaxID=85995 RepID=A0ABR3VRG9_HUMIN